jgi:hypothetical protein
MKTYSILLVLCCANIPLSFAQNTTAKISTVKTAGLHKMVVPTQLRSLSKEDLSDLRIFDTKANEVPYFVDQQKEINQTYAYASAYKIISETKIPKKQTTVIFENPEKTISEVVLSVANYDGEKTYSLSGSNDQKNWYGINNNKTLSELNAPEDLNVYKTIVFPKSNYRFFKIDLNDKNSSPISIQGIGKIKMSVQKNNLLPVVFDQKTMALKLEKKTQIHITANNRQLIDQIQFEITAPKMYDRAVSIYKVIPKKIKHKVVNYPTELASFRLHSGTSNVFNFEPIHENDFYIEIANDDNQPLEIKNVSFFQIPVCIIADLKANESYTIKTGKPDLMLPVYDLENFKSSISNNLPIATITDVKTKTATVKPIEKTILQQPWFMWGCIIIGGICIVYFARTLIKDMNNQTNLLDKE